MQMPRGAAASGPATVALGGVACERATAAWCARVRTLIADGHRTVDCDVRDLAGCAAAVIEALARIHLAANRSGGRIRILGADEGLLLVLGLAGLTDLLPDR
ncbi:hypothetical protein BJY24_004772 [Nocardia transvalensis]|uniref:STAS domain-containing protein n=1 Tax=Nocardia transvalensis TaxID=37333 RepID=A0A7W9PGX3_9NOCA|nr:STAS domain-containing protein [Nocardia transvalensis]MBB5915860.1 hypothetical protein [Nocardia transvalensis]